MIPTSRVAPTLRHAAERLRRCGVPDNIVGELDRLAGQVDEPCVIAVVGRVKAGKSTFINALLGDDLARTGTTETTATINHLRHGRSDPAYPVRCHWRDGRVTSESRDFLDDLQGHDEDTLRRAGEIDYLEYLVSNPFLERATLVDTPGTGAAVEEHGQRTADYLRIAASLRARHDEETRQLASDADAVIYLVGPTATTGDRELLEEFRRTTGGTARPFNAIGVLAKIDLDPALVARRDDLAARLNRDLGGELNVVVPVSAGLRRALDGLVANECAGLRRLRDELSRIPTDLLTGKLLASDAFWLDWDHPECPVSPDERADLLGDLPWTVFTTITAVIASTPSLEEARRHLEAIAGFDDLRQVLERRFLSRGHLLRSFRIVQDARRIVDQLRRVPPATANRGQRRDGQRLERFLEFIAASPGDPAVATELAGFVRDHLATESFAEAIEAIERDLAGLYWSLEGFAADHEALQQVLDHPQEFPEAEELQALFRFEGVVDNRPVPPGVTSVDEADNRLAHWSRVEATARSTVRRSVAERAANRYGQILDDLLGDAP